jgi:hypothetical protein
VSVGERVGDRSEKVEAVEKVEKVGEMDESVAELEQVGTPFLSGGGCEATRTISQISADNAGAGHTVDKVLEEHKSSQSFGFSLACTPRGVTQLADIETVATESDDAFPTFAVQPFVFSTA